MAWGLQPKHEIKHNFNTPETQVLHDNVLKAFEKNNFTISNDSLHLMQFYKKFKMNLMTFMYFAKPILNVDVYITKNGEVTLKSIYDYTSSHATPINDSGKSKKELDRIMSSLK